MAMTSRERLMASLRGQPVDRPAVNFYEIGGSNVDGCDQDPFNIYNAPSWQPLLQLAEEETDLIRMRSPVITRANEECYNEFFKTETYSENSSRFTRVTLTVAGRTMTSLSRRNADLDTIWVIEHLAKSTDDIEAYLQLPDDVFAEHVDTNNLIQADEKVGDRGIVMVDTPDPLCLAASLMTMEDYTIIAMTEQALFHRLLERFAEQLHRQTKQVAETFPGHLWRIFGPEYAAEPYLPPRLFHEYVVRYTGPMVQTILEHGGFPRIHSHGRIRSALPYIVEMGAVAIDPIEPEPQGDVDLAYVRREYGDMLTLFGNLEIADIENADPADFEKTVAASLRDGTSGTGRGFVLMPSAAPYGRTISKTTMTNYETMVRLATQY